MQVRWSPEAADDLARTVEHIRKDSAIVARRVAKDIYERAGALRGFPHGGRKGPSRGHARTAVDAPAIHRRLSGAWAGSRNCQYHPWGASLGVGLSAKTRQAAPE